jgi:hypothetical protein
VRVSGLELGGLFGSLLAGRLSDMLIARSGGKGGNVGKRVQVGGRGPRAPRGSGPPAAPPQACSHAWRVRTGETAAAAALAAAGRDPTHAAPPPLPAPLPPPRS